MFEIMDHAASGDGGVASRGRAGSLNASIVDFGGSGATSPDLVVGRRKTQQRGDVSTVVVVAAPGVSEPLVQVAAGAGGSPAAGGPFTGLR